MWTTIGTTCGPAEGLGAAPVGNSSRTAHWSLEPSHPCGNLWIPPGQPHPR